MPLRVLNYDGAVYRSQYKTNTDKDKCYPVVTLVIYFGKEDWNYGTNLHACLDIPPELLPYVSDYQMNFFSVKDMSNEQIESFQSDFRVIAEFFKALNTGSNYHPTDKKLEHPEETLDMISVFAGDNRFRNEYNELTDETRQGGISMCEIYDKIQHEGIAIGREEGRAEGKATILKKLQKLGNTVKQLAVMFEMSESEVEKLLAMDI